MSKRPDPDAPDRDQPSAVILDWFGPFAARVMSRINEYDDDAPKRRGKGSIVSLTIYIGRARTQAERR